MSGYLGGVAVIALGLGSLGLSFDKITWVASALSVGIGFGLQSIVQNFISGLILLTERPSKSATGSSLAMTMAILNGLISAPPKFNYSTAQP